MADLLADDSCPCASCEDRRQWAGKPCRACGGTGRVLSATGAPRPCSRCNAEEFRQWAANAFERMKP